jgi:hypothetical protein
MEELRGFDVLIDKWLNGPDGVPYPVDLDDLYPLVGYRNRAIAMSGLDRNLSKDVDYIDAPVFDADHHITQHRFFLSLAGLAKFVKTAPHRNSEFMISFVDCLCAEKGYIPPASAKEKWDVMPPADPALDPSCPVLSYTIFVNEIMDIQEAFYQHLFKTVTPAAKAMWRNLRHEAVAQKFNNKEKCLLSMRIIDSTSLGLHIMWKHEYLFNTLFGPLNNNERNMFQNRFCKAIMPFITTS